jgi:phage gpG-like protein
MKVTIALTATIAQQKLARLIGALGPAPMLKVIGARLMSYVDESFRTSGRGNWPALRPSTLALRKSGGDQPLQDTGRYKQSFVVETGETYVEVGSSLKTPDGIPLAAIHERGTQPYVIRVKAARMLAAQTRGGFWMRFGKEVRHPGVPARPVLPTQEQAEKLVQETVDEMIEMEAKRAGG